MTFFDQILGNLLLPVWTLTPIWIPTISGLTKISIILVQILRLSVFLRDSGTKILTISLILVGNWFHRQFSFQKCSFIL